MGTFFNNLPNRLNQDFVPNIKEAQLFVFTDWNIKKTLRGSSPRVNNQEILIHRTTGLLLEYINIVNGINTVVPYLYSWHCICGTLEDTVKEFILIISSYFYNIWHFSIPGIKIGP